MTQKKIIFIVGPTAVGKSDIAASLALKTNGEIVSCDSMQIYKEISIASGKPSPEILKQIPHYLIGEISMEDNFDVGLFNQLALKAIHNVHSKGHLPIVVGGSGMYMQILLDGIFDEKGKDFRLREELKKRFLEEGSDVLYEELKEVDPEAASKIHPNDIKRLLRALEVYYHTRKPISEMQKKREGLWGHYDIHLFALNREREELYQRINERVDKMFDCGLIDEIKGLANLHLSKTAEAVIGIAEVRSYLKGECSLERAKENMKQNTRHFAKSQLTWFRKEKRLKWMDIEKNCSYEQVAQKILKEI